jgi:hypothetical protein
MHENIQETLNSYLAEPTKGRLDELHGLLAKLLPGAEIEPLVRVLVTERDLLVKSPLHADWTASAKGLRGMWDRARGGWRFDDVRSLDLVREKLLNVYGECGDPVEHATVRVELEGDLPAALYGFGRLLADRGGRDSRVDLGTRVLLVKGAFREWGGSAKYPRIGEVEGVVIEVRDVPVSKLLQQPKGAKSVERVP